MLVVFTAACLGGQNPPPKQQEPPEEDESLAVKEYSFNPLQAEKELRIGSYYFKRGNYRAALTRFKEAAKWNEGFAEAYLRMGEAEQKLKNAAGARKAYEKCLELEPQGKHAAEVKKKLQELGKQGSCGWPRGCGAFHRSSPETYPRIECSS